MIRTLPTMLARRSPSSRPDLVFDISHLCPEGQLVALLSRPSINGTLHVEIKDRLRGEVCWTLLLQLARTHGVASLVHQTIMAQCPDVLPKESGEAFRRYVQSSAALKKYLSDEFIALLDAFEAKGIRVIPFIGPMLGPLAYGNAALRECIALSFIVEESSVHQARQLLWARGYVLMSQTRGDGVVPEESFVKQNGACRIHLQFTVPVRLPAFRLDPIQCGKESDSIRLGQRLVPALAPEELLILLCQHGCMHAWDKLQWVCDVAHLAYHRRGIDWSRLLFVSREWRCRRTVLMGLALARTLFATSVPPVLLREIESDRDVPVLAKRMPCRLLRSGLNGIDEEDVDALALTLKDSLFEQWRHSVVLCRSDAPMITKSLPWFRLQNRLRRLYAFRCPLDRLATWCGRFLQARKVITKWLETPG